jgi:hypothetical protein
MVKGESSATDLTDRARALHSPPMAVRLKPLLTLAALVLALVLAAPAGAQQAPTLGAPETQTNTAPPPQDTSTTGNGGLKTWQQVLIFGAGLILLAGIGFAIVSDARERTRRLSRHGTTAEAAGAAGVPHKHSQQAKQRARAKARQAKAQRRKNR